MGTCPAHMAGKWHRAASAGFQGSAGPWDQVPGSTFNPHGSAPTSTQAAQQEGAGIQLYVEDPLVLLHDGDQNLYQLHQPRQTWQGRVARLSLGPGAGGGKGVRTRPGSPTPLGVYRASRMGPWTDE